MDSKIAAALPNALAESGQSAFDISQPILTADFRIALHARRLLECLVELLLYPTQRIGSLAVVIE
jgi:hypothetical protein